MSTEKEKNAAIVLAAGSGSRMHSDIPKQYLDLCGKEVLAWSLLAFEKAEEVSEIVLVCSEKDIPFCRESIVEKYGISKVKMIVPGGAERYLSVWAGLQALDTDTDYVLIHDGARPLVDGGIICRTLEKAKIYSASVAAMPVKDTIKVSSSAGFADHTPDRKTLWQVQTPQVFSYGLVYGAYRDLVREGRTDVTDDAMVVETMRQVRCYLAEGSYRNIKITTPEDLLIARALLDEKTSGVEA